MMRFFYDLEKHGPEAAARLRDYVGIHIDGEGSEKYKGTHKDYKYAIVLHFGLTYEGGDTVIYPSEKRKALRLPEYSVLIITG